MNPLFLRIVQIETLYIIIEVNILLIYDRYMQTYEQIKYIVLIHTKDRNAQGLKLFIL